MTRLSAFCASFVIASHSSNIITTDKNGSDTITADSNASDTITADKKNASDTTTAIQSPPIEAVASPGQKSDAQKTGENSGFILFRGSFILPQK